mmetsp:Transcript_2648/g.7495  ORF Transcript_2648/g.7495 Transcript_2648/m.7495 type:complete len:464 (+) Transcript_2648:480-1871(+)
MTRRQPPQAIKLALACTVVFSISSLGDSYRPWHAAAGATTTPGKEEEYKQDEEYNRSHLHDREWLLDITENPCRYNFTDLDRVRWICEGKISGLGPGYSGPKLADPHFQELKSIEDFDFEDIREDCAKGDLLAAVPRLPLLLPYRLNPEDFFITQDNIPEYMTCNYRFKDYLPKIYSHLTPSLKNHLRGTRGSGRLGTCAIVGSSGSLMRRHYGGEIELHDSVWRFNLAPSGGEFQRHVGRKTNFRVLNAKTTRVYGLKGHTSPNSRQIEKLYFDNDSTMLMARVQPSEVAEAAPVLKELIKKSGQNVRLTMNDQRFLNFANYAMNNFRACYSLGQGEDILALQRESFTENWKTATTGMLTVITALQLCDHVSVYGMGEPEKAGHLFHYYAYNFTAAYGKANTGAHEWDVETEMLAEMAKAGLIRHCTIEGCSGRSVSGKFGVNQQDVWKASSVWRQRTGGLK